VVCSFYKLKKEVSLLLLLLPLTEAASILDRRWSIGGADGDDVGGSFEHT
jgi:hypothetical protein